MVYTMQSPVDGSFDETVERTIEALDEEGFGVLCDIDLPAVSVQRIFE